MIPLRGCYHAALVIGLLCSGRALLGQEKQHNIVFRNIPEFLQLDWELVLGPGEKSEVVSTPGAVITGNGSIMITTKENAKVVADFAELEVDSVIQYNVPSYQSKAGYDTFFCLHSANGDAILYPGADFWTISFRFARTGPYTSYIAILPGRAKALRDESLYSGYLERERRFLSRQYQSLAKGLDP